MKKVQLITITPEELIQPIFDYIDQKIYQLKKPEEYLTRNDVLDLLSIKSATLHKWTRNKILQSYRIGGRVLYKRSEIEESIIKIN